MQESHTLMIKEKEGEEEVIKNTEEFWAIFLG